MTVAATISSKWGVNTRCRGIRGTRHRWRHCSRWRAGTGWYVGCIGRGRCCVSASPMAASNSGSHVHAANSCSTWLHGSSAFSPFPFFCCTCCRLRENDLVEGDEQQKKCKTHLWQRRKSICFWIYALVEFARGDWWLFTRGFGHPFIRRS